MWIPTHESKKPGRYKIEYFCIKPITDTKMSPIVLHLLIRSFCIFVFSSILSTILVACMKRSRPRPTYIIREQRQIINLEEAVLYVLQKNDIQHREELEDWCGGKNRELFYAEVKKIAPLRWQMVPDPKKCVRDIYQSILPGYTNARITPFHI